MALVTSNEPAFSFYESADLFESFNFEFKIQDSKPYGQQCSWFRSLLIQYLCNNSNYRIRKECCISVLNQTSKRWEKQAFSLILTFHQMVLKHPQNGSLKCIFTLLPPYRGTAKRENIWTIMKTKFLQLWKSNIYPLFLSLSSVQHIATFYKSAAKLTGIKLGFFKE